MKSLLFFISILSVYCNINNVFFGYPDSDYTLKDGDIIIVSIPTFQDGYFIDSPSLDSLISFINKDQGLKYRIELNAFYVGSDLNKAITENLCFNLSEIFKEEAISENYELIARGSENPIFLNKESELYNRINTRIDIFINKR